MGCKNPKTLLPFFLTFICGVLIANLFQNQNEVKAIDTNGREWIGCTRRSKQKTANDKGTGSSSDGYYYPEINCLVCKDGHIEKNFGYEQIKELKKNNSAQTPLTITYKPKPNYTNEARSNETQGTVLLRIQFLANGTIGAISTINSLPNGLTESSIEAARQIKFNPATKNGQPVSVSKTLQFTFTIY